MDELNLYKIDCENIEHIIKKDRYNMEDVEVSVKNDEKYRHLRTIIMKQRKEIDDLKSKNKILEELISKN